MDNNKGLTGPLPSLSGFTKLEILSLENTQLEGSIPNEWGELIQLEDLDLSGMFGINGVLPLLFRLLTNLKYLDLYKISITGTIPDTFGDLVSLEYFTAIFTEISGTIPTTVGFLTNLGKRLKPNCKTQLFMKANTFLLQFHSAWTSLTSVVLFRRNWQTALDWRCSH